jgi:hypothetical protein
MNTKLETIEDCLEIITGLVRTHSFCKFDLDQDDKTIVNSIARQVFKGKALTDRQFALMQTKLAVYESQFVDNSYNNFQQAISKLRMPLRQIDRSKYVKIVEGSPKPESQGKWIKIRFPFSKKDILKIDVVATKNRKKYWHEKGSHEHYFKLDENTVFDVCEIFVKKDFEIDKKILEYYEQILEIKQEPGKHIAGLWNNEIKNISSAGLESIDKTERLHLLDRKRQYGLNYITCDKDATLANYIAHRSKPEICIDPKEHTIDSIVESLLVLQRFPILCLLDKDEEYDQLVTLHTAFRNIVENKKQSVLYRKENTREKDRNFNTYIHNKNLNNWVDNSTKIVYISKSKLPKLLLTVDWKPQCVLAVSSTRMMTQLGIYVNDVCDLHICHDESPSYFSMYSRRYG